MTDTAPLAAEAIRSTLIGAFQNAMAFKRDFNPQHFRIAISAKTAQILEVVMPLEDLTPCPPSYHDAYVFRWRGIACAAIDMPDYRVVLIDKKNTRIAEVAI